MYLSNPVMGSHFPCAWADRLSNVGRALEVGCGALWTATSQALACDGLNASLQILKKETLRTKGSSQMDVYPPSH